MYRDQEDKGETALEIIERQLKKTKYFLFAVSVIVLFYLTLGAVVPNNIKFNIKIDPLYLSFRLAILLIVLLLIVFTVYWRHLMTTLEYKENALNNTL